MEVISVFHTNLYIPSPSSYQASIYPSTNKTPKLLLSLFLQAIIVVLLIFFFFIIALISVLVLIHICITGRVFQHESTSRRYNFVEGEIDFGSRLSQKDLLKLPSYSYGGGDDPRMIADCAVCLDGFSEGERYRALHRCKHIFHATCIDKWLIKVSSCPICREKVVL